MDEAPCPLCGNAQGEPVWRERGYLARACGCGMLCAVPAPQDSDPTKELHAEGYYKYAAGLRMNEVRRFKRSGRLLDVGCGTGLLLEVAKAKGFDADGLEPHTKRAAVARSRGFDVREALVEQAALSPRYDVVFNTDLLSHFPDPVLALRAMAQGLAPTGIICLEVGIVAEISPGWYRLTGGLGMPDHRWFYSQRALIALFGKAGLKVERTRRFGLAPAATIVGLRRLLWPLLGRFVSGSFGETGEQGRLHSLYDWAQYVLRYRVGAWFPKFGPQTAIFILSRA